MTVLPAPTVPIVSQYGKLKQQGSMNDPWYRYFAEQSQKPNNPLFLGSFSSGSLPDPTLWQGAIAYVTDWGTIAVSDGTDWFRVIAGGPVPATSDPILYLNPAGSDANAFTSASPGKSLLGAWLRAQGTITLAGRHLTIKLQNGTYDASVGAWGFLVSPMPGERAYSTVTISGDTVTPSNVVVDGKGGSCIGLSGPVRINIEGIKFTDSVGGSPLISVGNNAYCTLGTGLIFDKGLIQLFPNNNGTIAAFQAAYTISGNPSHHIYAEAGGIVDLESTTVTLSGVPAWGNDFAYAGRGATIYHASSTFVGTATGRRFYADGGGAFQGDTLTAFPGNVAGFIANGGVYNARDTGLMYTMLPVAFTVNPGGNAPYEGQLQNFTDSNTNVWGANIAGGGANHVLGYYNGTNWTVAAK